MAGSIRPSGPHDRCQRAGIGELSGNHVGLALDLGWCIVRTLNEEQLCRVRSTQRFRRERIHIWMATGISPVKQKKLTVDQLNELRYALQWLMLPIGEPKIGAAAAAKNRV